MNNVLITGLSGFAGSFLASHLLSATDDTIYGTYHSGKGLKHVEHLGEKLQPIQVDLMDQDQVDGLIEKVRPQVIYHLAALASPSQSFKDPAATFDTNIKGEIHLLESVRKHNLHDTRILIISSAEVYGIVKDEDLPIDEDTNLNPTSPYAVSKIAQDFLGLQYYLSYNLTIVRARPFNHIGPRQTPQYVVASFAKQIAEIERGEKEPVMKVGNLSAKRDFTDVRDIVRAYTQIVQNGDPGDVYNIGSGTSTPISDILDTLISLSRVSIHVEVDSTLLKPVDIPDNRCDRTKLTHKTGWEPQIGLDQSLHDVLDYWRNIS